eukprot:3210632-Rhodomonas_salina.2
MQCHHPPFQDIQQGIFIVISLLIGIWITALTPFYDSGTIDDDSSTQRTLSCPSLRPWQCADYSDIP